MSATDEIRIQITGHGSFRMTVDGLDLLMERHLPASVEQLRDQLDERSGGDIDYSDLQTVTECLVIIGEYEGFTR